MIGIYVSVMADCNRFEPLRALPDDVLAEIVREAEARLSAQLEAATAADQRALTIAGFEITTATASLGAGIALIRATPGDVWLALLAVGFAVMMVLAAQKAVESAQPQDFDFPGNRPNAWLPGNWLGGATNGYSLKQARIEQAACLDDCIAGNSELMRRAGTLVNKSLHLSICATALAALLLFATFVARTWTIAEPTSEIIRK